MVSRPRSFFLCSHKGLVRKTASWATVHRNVCGYLSQTRSEPWQALLAGPEELHEEAMFLSEMRGKSWAGNWFDLLTPRELESLNGYRELHQARTQEPNTPNDIWNLGDNALSHCNWSETSGKIPTYRLHSQLYWCVTQRRPMTIQEKVATLGWPVYQSMLVDDALPAITPSRSESKHMLGNAWHLVNGTVAIASALASLEFTFPC